jgi:hypothetical protein
VVGAAAVVTVSESPEKNDFTRLVNEPPDDGGGRLADADGAGAAGGDVEPPPVRLVHDEQPASVAVTAAATMARRRHARKRKHVPQIVSDMAKLPVGTAPVSTLQASSLLSMENLYPEGAL